MLAYYTSIGRVRVILMSLGHNRAQCRFELACGKERTTHAIKRQTLDTRRIPLYVVFINDV